jgi:glycosyltransferase involved in cell wall biosynthesis
MDSKHIAIFIRYLPMGGIQKIAVRLANEFAKRGHTVDLVLAKGKGALADDVHPEVRTVDLNKNRVWFAVPALWGYLLRRRPRVLLALGLTANVVATWAKIISMHNLRVVISVHNNMSRYSENDSMWYSKYIPLSINLFYPLADKIIAVSEEVLEDMANISPKAGRKGSVIYNPVVDSEIPQKAEEPVSHPWLGEKNAPVVLGVGRLTPQKNFDLLLRAFARMKKERDARLIMLGEGNQCGQLESRIEALGIGNHVDLHGFVDNPYKYMANASLVVMSSRFEGLPTVLIEALACGCPVVSTDCPSGPREILEDGKWGRLVPVGDEAALAEAMDEALAETHDPERLRRRAQDFSVEKAVDEYLDVLLPDA